MKNTIIISAFPGTGKTNYFNSRQDLNILDSDSSKYSFNEDGSRNINFPQNYIKHIEEEIGEVDIIFVSTHENVRREMRSRGINYLLFYPKYELKNEYLARYIERGSSDVFVRLMTDKWTEFIQSCQTQKECVHVKMDHGKFISDYLNY